jgi:DNA-binding MarR family transcriptional regulator
MNEKTLFLRILKTISENSINIKETEDFSGLTRKALHKEIKISTGSLHRILKQMENDDLINERKEKVENRKQYIYTLTPKGIHFYKNNKIMEKKTDTIVEGLNTETILKQLSSWCCNEKNFSFPAIVDLHTDKSTDVAFKIITKFISNIRYDIDIVLYTNKNDDKIWVSHTMDVRKLFEEYYIKLSPNNFNKIIAIANNVGFLNGNPCLPHFNETKVEKISFVNQIFFEGLNERTFIKTLYSIQKSTMKTMSLAKPIYNSILKGEEKNDR